MQSASNRSGERRATADSVDGVRRQKLVLLLARWAGFAAWPSRFRRGPCWSLAVFLLATSAGVLLRLTLFFAASQAVHLVRLAVEVLIGLVPSADPVYTRATLETLTDIRVAGVAVVEPIGSALHALVPSLFLEPGLADATLVRPVVDPASAVLARLVVATLANGATLGVGLALLVAGVQRRWPSLAVIGLVVQVQVAFGIVASPPTLEELEATGLSFAVNVLLPWLTGRRVALSDLFVTVPAPLVAAGLVALALLVGYLPSLLALVLLARRGVRPWCEGVVVDGLQMARRPIVRPVLHTAGALTIASAVIGGLTAPSSAPAAVPVVLGDVALGTLPTEEAAAPPLPPAATAMAGPRASAPARTPSKVEIRGSGYRYQYLVNGRRRLIKGMGLNIQYRRYLTPSGRAARLDADLAEMRRLGVNTVLGWDQQEFDLVLFDLAYKYGIGVIAPYPLDPRVDYTDRAVRDRLTASVLEWVRRYRSHPALRMWGLGNEVLHKIVHPAWLGPQDPQRDRKAHAFADWLIETADLIHQLDPDHPVTYRDAENAFVPWVAAALKRRGGEPRPWFTYGTNCYTDYLSSVVDQWPSLGMDVALWVSEFAPAGTVVAGRPEAFQKMWGYIRRRPEWVLGGAVYAWTRYGPEEIDRTMGITNDGAPVDPRIFHALETIFQESVDGA